MQGILDRYRQIKPKFIFSETEVMYSGKIIDLVPNVAEVVQDLVDHAGLSHVILLPSAKTGKEVTRDITGRVANRYILSHSVLAMH